MAGTDTVCNDGSQGIDTRDNVDNVTTTGLVRKYPRSY